jgi:hypothetical protein
MTLTVGKDKEQVDILVDEPTVSGRHCRITMVDDASFIVEDLDSTNYTFLNGVPVKTSRMSNRDQLRLGKFDIDYNWLKGQFNKSMNAKKTDFKKEFAELKSLYEQHKNQLNRIDARYQRNDAILRTAVGIGAPLVAFLLNQNVYVVGVVGTLSLTWILLFKKSNLKAQQEKEEASVQFMLKYRCPKCGLEFGNKNWKLIEADGACQKCKAKFI